MPIGMEMLMHGVAHNEKERSSSPCLCWLSCLCPTAPLVPSPLYYGIKSYIDISSFFFLICLINFIHNAGQFLPFLKHIHLLVPWKDTGNSHSLQRWKVRGEAGDWEALQSQPSRPCLSLEHSWSLTLPLSPTQFCDKDQNIHSHLKDKIARTWDSDQHCSRGVKGAGTVTGLASLLYLTAPGYPSQTLVPAQSWS